MADLGRHLAEMRESAGDVLRIWCDRLKVEAREVGFLTLFGLWGALVVAVLSISASIAVLAGLSGGLALALGGREWAGDLAAGALVLGAMAVGLVLLRARARRTSLQSTMEKYRRRPPRPARSRS